MRMLLAIVAALAVAGQASAQTTRETIKVGSKDFTEQFIVAELYAGALEAAGFAVERKINLGGTMAAHEALSRGAIDLYPEYTGTGLSAVMKINASTDSDARQTYRAVKAFYEKEYKLTWLAPSGIDNGHVLVVRPETAQAMKLRRVSDLVPVAGKLTVGAGPEFADRLDGLKGLKDVYGITFGTFQPLKALRLRYEALSEKQIDVAAAFATDWQLTAGSVVPLGDDKDLFPPYQLAPLVRLDTVASKPRAVEALLQVGSLLDNQTMRELNRQVEVDNREPHDVAAAFLKAKGMLP